MQHHQKIGIAIEPGGMPAEGREAGDARVHPPMGIRKRSSAQCHDGAASIRLKVCRRILALKDGWRAGATDGAPKCKAPDRFLL